MIILQVIGTLHLEWLEKNIKEAMRTRNTLLEDEEKGEFIEVDESILRGL